MRSLFVLLALVGAVAAFYVIPDAGGEEEDAQQPVLVPLSNVREEKGNTRMADFFGAENFPVACFEPGCNQHCRYYHYDGGRCVEGTCYCWYYDPWGRSQGASK